MTPIYRPFVKIVRNAMTSIRLVVLFGTILRFYRQTIRKAYGNQPFLMISKGMAYGNQPFLMISIGRAYSNQQFLMISFGFL